MTELIGLCLLLLTLGAFSLFSLKCYKGNDAMSGMANAAIASFLVEAIYKYIFGDIFNIAFLGQTGLTAGSMGGVAAGIMVPISMGVNPLFAIVAGVAVGGYGILPGFIAGYCVGLIEPLIKKYVHSSIITIAGALIIAPFARLIAFLTNPLVNTLMSYIGNTISAATTSSPYFMGFVLGGIMKMICTSPLSSMALTAMLGLTGLPMGIAAIACFGGAFTNAFVFRILNFGNKDSVIGVALEPLTQAHIITKHPLPIYCSNFIGGGLSGIAAVFMNIVNNAPGTASPIPGMIAPFAFNEPENVLIALALAAIGGSAAGIVGGILFKKTYGQNKTVTVTQ